MNKQLLSDEAKREIVLAGYSREILSYERYEIVDAGFHAQTSTVFSLLMAPDYADDDFKKMYYAAHGESFPLTLLELSKDRVTTVIDQEDMTYKRFAFDASAISKVRFMKGDVLDLKIDGDEAKLMVYRNDDLIFCDRQPAVNPITQKMKAFQKVKAYRDKLRGLLKQHGALTLKDGMEEITTRAVDKHGKEVRLTLTKGEYPWEPLDEGSIPGDYDARLYVEGIPYEVASHKFQVPEPELSTELEEGPGL